MANPQEAALQYPLADTLPEPGQAIEVAPGVHWLRMRLPFALDHINLWLLEDRQQGEEGFSIVDCGIDDAGTRAAWAQVIEHHIGARPVFRVICTHMHPDHIGLAHWLCERFSTPERECRLWVSSTDWNAARVACRSTTGFGGEHAARFFAAHGLTDPGALAQVRARSGYYPSLVPAVPETYRRLMDGMPLAVADTTWRCVVGYGHAPEHIALYREATARPAPVLISGDMVLPRISTNVSVFDLEPEADPLPLYLRSIESLRTLPAGTLVLPSHGKPFFGLHERIAQLQAHHDARLSEVMQACTEAPRSAADLLPLLFRRPLDLHQTTFAMGEAVAHLHALWGQEWLVRQRGADGVLRFAAAG